jgi:hypothetical protein
VGRSPEKVFIEKIFMKIFMFEMFEKGRKCDAEFEDPQEGSCLRSARARGCSRRRELSASSARACGLWKQR